MYVYPFQESWPSQNQRGQKTIKNILNEIYPFINILLHFFETYGIWKFISIKNGVISKPANLQSKLIDSFTCDTSFHWKEFLNIL